jgi:RimJ/RimL family protein N-acetyltransferase
MFTIRKTTPDDTDNLASFMLQLDKESEYLLYNPDEPTNSKESRKKFLHKITKNERSAIFIAEHATEGIVAYVCGEAYSQERLAHVMRVNIGALKKYQKKGVGRLLAYALHEHAKKIGIYRAEASVIQENKISLNLSKRMGFELEGIKKHAFKIGDRFHNECLLVKFLD